MAAQSKPNIVLIFTDNQQASTLACFGNPEIHTPHLDALASQGMAFDNAFCPNAFCSPCRASLLTGLMPSQHGIHSWLDDRRAGEWPGGWHALEGHNTLPEQLKSAGYNTALIGKYHLGQPTTPMPGFDHWVTMEDGHVRSFYRNQIMDNGKSYFHEGHSVDFFTDKALAYLKQQQAAEQPFFLFLPYPAPYGHWPATKEADRCRHSARYDDCPIDSIPRQGLSKTAVDGFLMRNKYSDANLDFSMLLRAPNDLATLRNYYAQISMVDEGVGKIIAELDQLGMTDDTVVIFTADHGLSMGHHGFWGHGAATMPSNLHRAAHSIPLIVRQQGSIEAGSRSNAMVSNMDLYSTVLEMAGIEPAQSAMPSRSLNRLLRGEAATHDDDAVYSEQEETRTIRTQKWTYFQRFSHDNGPDFIDELYDVQADPDETTNLIDAPEHAAIRTQLAAKLTAFFQAHSNPQSDLWTGGQPIQNSARIEYWQQIWGADWNPVFAYNDA